MRPLPIRIRLAAWYTAIFACAVSASSCTAYWTVERGLRNAVDDGLRSRVEGTRRFLETQLPTLSLAQLANEFQDHLVVAMGPSSGPMQVCDADGRFLYRAPSFKEIDLPPAIPRGPAGQLVFENRTIGGHPVRMVTARVDAGNRSFGVQVATVTTDNERALASLEGVLLAAEPLLLLVAAAGGYWISSRALQPVAAMTEAARSITTRNLNQRVPVPLSRDELSALAETLNAMFDRIESAFRRVTRFTGDASHELRSPVAVIRTAADVALRAPRTAEDYRLTLEQVRAEAERMSALVDDLLALARSDTGGRHLVRRAVDLRGLLGTLSSRARTLAVSRGLAFDETLPAGPVIIEADPGAIARLVMILTDNAVKYTPAPGHVAWSFHADTEVAVFEVSDTGIGVEAGDLPHIFDRFYRADRARHRDGGGAGLGLSIARWIADEHGGTISVVPLAQGTCFRVILPFR